MLYPAPGGRRRASPLGPRGQPRAAASGAVAAGGLTPNPNPNPGAERAAASGLRHARASPCKHAGHAVDHSGLVAHEYRDLMRREASCSELHDASASPGGSRAVWRRSPSRSIVGCCGYTSPSAPSAPFASARTATRPSRAPVLRCFAPPSPGTGGPLLRRKTSLTLEHFFHFHTLLGLLASLSSVP